LGRRSGALLNQAEISACEWLCPPIPLCLLLEDLDGIPHLSGIVPTGSAALLENQSPRCSDALMQFGKMEHREPFGINRLALLLQGLDLPWDL